MRPTHKNDGDSSDDEVNFDKLKPQEVMGNTYNTFEKGGNVAVPLPDPAPNPGGPPGGGPNRRMSVARRVSVQLQNSYHVVKTQLQVQPVPYDELEERAEEVKEVEAKKEKRKRNKLRKYRGFFYTICSSFVFSISALLVKKLHGYNPMTIALWRFQGALLPALPLVILHYTKKAQKEYKKELIIKEKKHGRWTNIRTYLFLLFRSILTCNALLLHYYSLTYLPIGDALVINSCTPIFAYIFAFFFLGEPMGLVPLMTSVVTLLGVVFIIKPPLFSGGADYDMDTLLGAGLALGSTVLATCSYIMLRYIRRVHYSVTTLFYGLWGTIETLATTLALGYFSFPQGNYDWTIAGVLAGLTFAGQMAIILALKCDKTGPVTLIRTCDVIFGFIWQIVFFSLVPDVYSLVGASIVIMGVVIITFRKWLESLNEASPLRTKLRFLLK